MSETATTSVSIAARERAVIGPELGALVERLSGDTRAAYEALAAQVDTQVRHSAVHRQGASRERVFRDVSRTITFAHANLKSPRRVVHARRQTGADIGVSDEHDAGKRAEADRIWDGLEALYRDDPAAAAMMAELRKDRGK